MTTVIDTTSTAEMQPAPAAPKTPLSDLQAEPKGAGEKILVAVFVAVPMLALLAAIPLAWGWGLGWHDVIIAVGFYYLTGLGGSAMTGRRSLRAWAGHISAGCSTVITPRGRSSARTCSLTPRSSGSPQPSRPWSPSRC